jgi:hypothetical protein
MGIACESVSAGRISFVVQAAKRFLQMPLVLAVLAVFAGCAPTRMGATLDALAAPKPGAARVVVLRDRAFPGIFDTGWQAYLDEVPMGDLKTGRSFTATYPRVRTSSFSHGLGTFRVPRSRSSRRRRRTRTTFASK